MSEEVGKAMPQSSNPTVGKYRLDISQPKYIDDVGNKLPLSYNIITTRLKMNSRTSWGCGIDAASGFNILFRWFNALI